MMTERITTAGIALRDGRVLVARRIEEGAIGGKWEFPGGKHRWGESPADTLCREWKEELGAEIEPGEEFFSFDFENKDVLYHLKAFYVTLLADSLTLSVHSETRWAGAEELRALDFARSDRKISEYLLERNIVRDSL